MNVRIREYKEKRYGIDEYRLVSYNIIASTEHDEAKFKLREGEPEDMIFGRNLQGHSSIVDMLIMAHEAGKAGRELDIEVVEEV